MKYPLFALCSVVSITTALTACGGGGTSTPTAGGGTSTSTAGGGTSTPTAGGGTSTPTAGGGTSTSTAGGGTSTPTAGGGTSTSTAGGGTSTPTAGGGTSTPTAGGGTSTPTAGGGTSTPTATYTAVNYLQDLNTVNTTATFTDKGLGVVGSLSLRGSTINMTPNANADGGIVYGMPFTKSMTVSSNTADSNLPAFAMLCQQAALGDGTNGVKSTDVLIANTATRVTKASTLANQSFSIYREDCATLTANTLSFNASGDATVVFTSNGTAYNYTITAADLTAGLNYQAIAVGTGVYGTYSAYSYVKGNGSTAFTVVVHASPAVSALTRGFVGIYSQQ